MKRVVEIDTTLERWCRPLDEGTRTSVVTTLPNGRTESALYVSAKNAAGELEWVRVPPEPTERTRRLYSTVKR